MLLCPFYQRCSVSGAGVRHMNSQEVGAELCNKAVEIVRYCSQKVVIFAGCVRRKCFLLSTIVVKIFSRMCHVG